MTVKYRKEGQMIKPLGIQDIEKFVDFDRLAGAIMDRCPFGQRTVIEGRNDYGILLQDCVETIQFELNLAVMQVVLKRIKKERR